MQLDYLDYSRDRAIERLFTQRFPGVQFVEFRASARGAPPWARDWHALSFCGGIETLLSHRLIDQGMIPPGRKRTHYGWNSRGVRHWSTKRARAGKLRVLVNLGEDSDRSHPLADFGPWAWPFNEARPTLRLVVNNTQPR